MAIIKHNPVQFHELTVSKKIHWLSIAYMENCTEQGFTKSGMFQLRNYFKSRVDPVNYQVFFDYIFSLAEVTPTNLYDIYAASAKWQLNLRMQSNTPTAEIVKYPSLLDCLGDL